MSVPNASSQRSNGLTLPVPVLIGGAAGVAVLSIVVAFVAVWVLSAPAEDPPAAGATVPATQVATESTPVSPPAPASGTSSVPATAVADAAATRSPFPAAPGATDPPPTPNDASLDPATESNTAAAAVSAPDGPAGKPLTTADIVAESEASVALIKGKTSSGTGFLVGPGLLATNSHVIDDEFIPDLEVRFVSADEQHNAPLVAELLYEDPERDLAFLAVKTDLKPLRVAKTYTFRKGEDITVIGNPGLGDGQVLENAISRGVMSTRTQIDKHDFYQLGIAINPGNSGGPVFDSYGRVIGVATLKASKQEATGFSIPIEDVQRAVTKVAKESTGDAERYRSNHRVKTAVKGLGGGAALLCITIDLRRANAVSRNIPAVKEALGKLEPIANELDKDVFPSLATYAPRIKNDPLLAPSVRSKVAEMASTFARLRNAYSSGQNIDDNTLRSWKQTERRLITEVASALNLEIPPKLLDAFNDRTPAQHTTVTMAPQDLGAFGPRLRPRTLPGNPRLPGASARPPSLRDRMLQQRGRLRQ